MEHTYEELSGMTVAQLRDVAGEIEDERLAGIATMHKESLLPLLCEVLGVETHVHHEVVGIDKAKIKAEIRALKADRDAILAGDGDVAQLPTIRGRIKRLKRKIRRATV